MTIRMRAATKDDLVAIVTLFTYPDIDGRQKNDALGPPLPREYEAAFENLARDPNNTVWLAELDGAVVGIFQLTFIQYLANHGARVAMIENVVVAPDVRGRGIGETMMRWAMDEARRAGCSRIQLTSHKLRTRAHTFYERLGFTATHEGFKLLL
ncbi:MAG: GNAT family N-acetyltransferase [Polyangiaceae bacterium]